jgi:hypothetical protein
MLIFEIYYVFPFFPSFIENAFYEQSSDKNMWHDMIKGMWIVRFEI